MVKLSKEQSDFHLIDKLNSPYRYLDDIVTLNYSAFAYFTARIYQKEVTLNRFNIQISSCAS